LLNCCYERRGQGTLGEGEEASKPVRTAVKAEKEMTDRVQTVGDM
jgi:hypothetical protein